MAKKKKKQNKLSYFQKSRVGFYSLVAITASLMLLTLNLYGSANFPGNVLGESDRSGKNEDKAKEEARREEKMREEEEKREERQQKIQQQFEINPEKLKLEYESENGEEKIKRKIEFKNEEDEIDDDIEEDLGDDLEQSFEEENEAEIASDSSDVTIKKNKVKARIGFPLTIDGATNQLLVTRPDGTTKAVSILPDKAVANFMKHKKVNLINFEEPGTGSDSGETDNEGTESAQSSSDQTQIELVEYKDQIAYEIKGKKKLKLLGFFDVTTPTTGYVSAETGDVIGQDEPLITKILDILSP